MEDLKQNKKNTYEINNLFSHVFYIQKKYHCVPTLILNPLMRIENRKEGLIYRGHLKYTMLSLVIDVGNKGANIAQKIHRG